MDRSWSGKTEGGTFGQRFLLWYFRHGSIRLLYIVLALVVPFYMLVAHKRYLAIYHYFRKILHRSVLSSFVSTYRNHFLFGQAMFDKMALFAGRTNKYWLELVGNEVFDNQLDNPKGIVMASSHCGNFELAGHILKQKKHQCLGFWRRKSRLSESPTKESRQAQHNAYPSKRGHVAYPCCQQRPSEWGDCHLAIRQSIQRIPNGKV